MELPAVSQDEPGRNTSKALATNQLYNWIFTLKVDEPDDPYDEIKFIYEVLDNKCKKFTFQMEEGEGGYIHFQGCFSLVVKERFGTVKNILPNTAHIEPARNYKASETYCSKEKSRKLGPWTKNLPPIQVEAPSRLWQLETLKLLTGKPDPRKILWFWEPTGGLGKTSLAKFLVVRHGAMYVDTGNKSDIAYAMPANGTKICIFDLPRTLEGKDRLSYTAIEGVKNGITFSGKYESRCKVFNTPHVICFANFQPEFDKLSLDRWDVRRIDMWEIRLQEST